MIFVIATVEIADGKREAFLEEFRKIIPQVRAEEGCIEYGPTIDAETDIEAQSRNGENKAVIVEKWESIDALKAHLVAPHMQEYREKVKDLVKGMNLQILQPVE